jgi:uncharacterized protein with FMN-binding domain
MRALAALLITLAAVILLARYDTRPPRTVNPNAARATPPAIRAATPTPPPPGSRTADGPILSTPFSIIQVRATVLHGRLIGVQTVALTGDGPHTQALNARAEPILRAEALKAGSADIDTVSGATSSSKQWIESLRGAVAKARR